MAFQANRFPDEIHLYAATLDDPESFRAKFHVHHGDRLRWLKIDDGLRCYRSFVSDETSC